MTTWIKLTPAPNKLRVRLPQSHTTHAIAIAQGHEELIRAELPHIHTNYMAETNNINLSFTLEQRYRLGNAENYCFGYLDFDSDIVELWVVGNILDDKESPNYQRNGPRGPRARVAYDDPEMWDKLKWAIKDLLNHVKFNLASHGCH